MASLTLALAIQASFLAAGAQEYEQAYQVTQETGRPLVVLVGADWCPACQTMKFSTMPRLESAGKLKHVAFAVVNTDRQGVLANQLMRGSSIPQLIVYRRTPTGWARSQLTGAQSEQEIESLINQAVEHQATVTTAAKQVISSEE